MYFRVTYYYRIANWSKNGWLAAILVLRKHIFALVIENYISQQLCLCKILYCATFWSSFASYYCIWNLATMANQWPIYSLENIFCLHTRKLQMITVLLEIDLLLLLCLICLLYYDTWNLGQNWPICSHW